MALRRRSTGVLALSFFLGILVGALLSQAIGLFLEEGTTAHQLFVQYQSFGFGPLPIDLVVAEITLGFHARANLMSVLGIFVVAQIFRWFR